MNDQLPAIVVADRSIPATAAQMRAQVNRIQEVMQAVMKKDVHYGTIPGTPKPTLYQPGAEVLMATFHIAPSFVVEDLSGPEFMRYRITCRGTHQGSGVVLGDGLGECSSLEEKYKWRKAITDGEYEATAADRKRIKFGKKDGKEIQTKQVRTEPADQANTILKMAVKRAKVAMTINVTAASDIFTQDIEDLPESLRQDEEDAAEEAKERLDRLLKGVAEAKTTDELTAFWKAGVKECNDAHDKSTYEPFKAAVEARGTALKTASKPAADKKDAPEPGSNG